MSVSKPDYLRALYNAKSAAGQPSINSDATLQIVGYESILLQTKQFPWPVIGPSGEIEQAGPMGITTVLPAQLKIAQQGAITFTETSNGTIHAFMSNVARNRAVFDANAFEGTPDYFVRGYRLRDCFFVPDQADRDWENKMQLTQITGTLHFHFFDESIPGAVAVL